MSNVTIQKKEKNSINTNLKLQKLMEKETTENFYISSTEMKQEKNVSNVFDSLINSKTINDIIKYEIAY